MDVENPDFVQDEALPVLNRTPSPGDGEGGPHIPDPSHVDRVYHPKLTGQICDENSNDILPDTPPPAHDLDQGPDNWTPYKSQLEFEVADFLYRRNQMSAGDINFILGLWAASLAVHGDQLLSPQRGFVHT
ncbi:hypothetical protein DFH94DRAFT_798274 [Russula ochroleuca]|uniref:Uncharacterized protein n=1 Tax=Russula ochroleuca TaxID=152965 RepID=A0A9P5N769_9AGAM|nr:hypothetical protein DFH94DRAFT_798274 [Russula ochroleuca]